MTQPFAYSEGRLQAEGVAVEDIAAAVGTPFYLYSASAMQQAYRRFAGALQGAGLDALVCYAVKANPQLAVIATFAAEGAGADVVSEGELRRALAVGVPAEKIVFAGVGKTAGELALGLEAGILQFNVESREELRLLDQVARDKGVQAPVALRVNPDVDARTHAKITTGKSENKFGIDCDDAAAVLQEAVALPGILPVGLATHIGSQITDLEPYEAAFQRVAGLFAEQREAGVPLQRLDLGGGLGIAYQQEALPTPEDYAAVVARTAGRLDVPLVFEPGRHLVGEAGLLISRVVYVKQGRSRRFLIVDAGMNDLMRPALYEAWHDIVPLREPASAARLRYDVVGPICETGDLFAEGRELPELAAGDLVAFGAAGAYGATMASTYNSRPPVAEVMVQGDSFEVIRARPSHDALMRSESLPSWLGKVPKSG
ncbi:diaminopimelate decarboxylase [Aquibaculum arenosum]|uniref:Diaminopimelate decarboxylase n=1 Tax=Aquibaculum arenosum TaxID=3032591 RepID=A0ABT5YLA3_9PROT|nr:diaminopimelate decarboxylase [Fodinicurvata sp. CAU 1616]MDF2095606.1 diaminopimelate decarboxylase [Fodinicurvata sp. CAU 1616]